MKIKMMLAVVSGAMLCMGANAAEEDEFFNSDTTIGGYGELHYNMVDPESGDSDETLDFHRFVLFLSHGFTESWSFQAELELEHNLVESGDAVTDEDGTVTDVDGKGELELEQAYLDYHASSELGFQVGVILPSVGLLNENHEPPLFLSVERPNYSKYIVPTTWFGNGAALYGDCEGWGYRLVVMEGLDGSAFGAKGIRDGRQKGYKSDASELLYNASINYTGLPGLKAGTSVSYNNAEVDEAAGTKNAMTLTEFHVKLDKDRVHGVFEVGNVDFAKPELSDGVESSFGYYVDLGYDIDEMLPFDARITPFVRWEDINTASSTTAGGDSEKSEHKSTWMVGVAVLPTEQIIFKVDYSVETTELKGGISDYETTRINLGAGYMF